MNSAVHTTAASNDATAADEELYRLGEHFENAWAEEEAARIAAKVENTEASWEPWDRAYERTHAIVEQIERHAAHTVKGVQIKARCVQWCYGDDPVQLGFNDTTDNRIANQIISDLLQMESV